MSPETSKWFALAVTPRKEKVTAQTLRAKGYEEFLPLYTERRKWSDRVKPVQLPLFPGYVFCRLDPEVRLPVLMVPTVNHIIGFGKTPHPVEDSEIVSLQTICKAGVNAVPCPYLTAGSTVMIQEGPLKGVQGILVHDAVHDTDDHLVVSVGLLQRSISVRVERDWISPVRIYTDLSRN